LAALGPTAVGSLVAVTLLAACGATEGEGTAPVASTAPMPTTTVADPSVTPAVACIPPDLDEDGNMRLVTSAANNYSFSSTLQVAVTPVQPLTELTFDWSGLTRDFLGNAMDPALDIDTAFVIVWRHPVDVVTTKLNDDTLGPPDAAGAIARYTMNQVTSSSIFDFMVAGGGELPMADVLGRLDPAQFPPEAHSYTIMPSEGGEPGKGARMVHAFVLDPNSTNTTVTVTNDSTLLQADVDLTTPLRTAIPAGATNIVVDWDAMELNAMGREFVDRSIWEILVAKYAMTPTELEDSFLRIESIATEMYRDDVDAGENWPLTELVDETGNPFTGITADGTWVLALICGDCGNPAPWYLTILTPCG
jgi:hypothetical protein